MCCPVTIEQQAFVNEVAVRIGDYVVGDPILLGGVADNLSVLFDRLTLGSQARARRIAPFEADGPRCRDEPDCAVDHAPGDEPPVDGHGAHQLGLAGDVDFDDLDRLRVVLGGELRVLGERDRDVVV